MMDLKEKAFALCTILINGGYLESDIDLCIWVLEKTDSIRSRQKLCELFSGLNFCHLLLSVR